MGSTYFKTHKTVTHPLGRKERTYSFMQFVPGIVVDVGTHDSSYHSVKFKGFNSSDGRYDTINRITARPWIYDENVTIPKISELTKLPISTYQYAPLLRGITEVPSKGDPVLLCTIGGRNYYLGPLNTENDVNFNPDNLFSPDSTDRAGTGAPEFNSFYESMLNNGFTTTNHKRLQKMPKPALDLPASVPTSENSAELNPGEWQNSIKYSSMEIPGDIVVEGRHGNSLRIGSRSINPYVYISNGRDEEDNFENSNNGGLIGITSYGTLSEHFGFYASGITENEEFDLSFTPPTDENQQILENIQRLREPQPYENKKYFNLASDMSPILSNRTIYNTIKSLTYNLEKTAEDIIYGYKKNQMLFNSDRITINSKQDDIYLSSFKDVHIGARKNITISTSKDLIINSRTTVLGNPIKDNQVRPDLDNLVLASKLTEVLKDILSLLRNAHGICQGTALPLTDSMNQPLNIDSIERKITAIASSRHFIEPNE